MSPKSRAPRTILELALARGGFRKCRKVLLFGVAWGQVEVALGYAPSIDEYGAWWRQSRASAYREWAVWKEVLPEWETPSLLFDALGVDLQARAETALGGMAVPV